MDIDVKNIMAAYKTATESEKTLLSTLFPDLSLGQTDKAPDDRPVTERIKTFDDACCELGYDHPFVKSYLGYFENIHESNRNDNNALAYLQLRIICAALNEGWEPQFTESEWRWYPWHSLWTESELKEKSDEWEADRHLIMIGDKYQSEYAGLAFAYSHLTPSHSYTSFGSRLCLKSEALATYCGKQFIEIWADFLLTPKK